MCLAKAYLNSESGEPLMQEIARLHLEGDRIRLESLFGEGKEITGKIREIDFMTSKIVLEGKPG